MSIDQNTIINAQRIAYGDNFRRYGDSPKGTYQNDQTTQFIRFHHLLEGIRHYFDGGTSLHDLGSGLCDFYTFLTQRGLDKIVDYSGTEIVEEMNELARKKYPSLKLYNRNFLDFSMEDRYDFCIASGTFNLLGGVQESEWRKTCRDLIKAMFHRANKGIAFNILTSYRTFSDPTLCYFDPKEMFDFVTTELSRFVAVDASSPLYEVTFTVLKKDFISSNYPNEELRKYFR